MRDAKRIWVIALFVAIMVATMVGVFARTMNYLALQRLVGCLVAFGGFAQMFDAMFVGAQPRWPFGQYTRVAELVGGLCWVLVGLFIAWGVGARSG